MKNKKSRVISFISAKGGAGKTIIATDVAGVMSKLGYKTLLIDLDLINGCIGTYLNVISKNIIDLINDLEYSKYKDLYDYLYKYNDNLYILQSLINPIDRNKIKKETIDKIIKTAENYFDIIIIDTGNAYDAITVTAMDNSDCLISVFTNDIFDLKNSANLLSLIKSSDKFIYTILNDSIYLNKNYYSPYEIRRIINHNIDFTISDKCHLKNIDKYISDGKILILNKELDIYYKHNYLRLENMCKKIIKEGVDIYG